MTRGDAAPALAPPAVRPDEPVQPRRIGLDACCFVGSRTGIGNYVEALLGPLSRDHPEATFFLYVNDDGELPTGPNLVHRVSRPVRRGPLWHNTQLVDALQADAIEVFWGTNGLIPLRGLQRTASVVTVHDLAHRFVPGTQRAAVRWKQRLFQPLCARAADRLVAVSRATAADVARHYGREPDAVIAPCAAPGFVRADAADVAATLARLGIAAPYLLTVGTLEPRKNLLALVQAYRACAREGAALPPLVIAGGHGWHDEKLQRALADPSLGGRIRWLGFVATERLAHLYSGCAAFIMPSLYEGFGMPLLEAQRCGAPVVHGPHASMAEASGGVGVVVGTSVDALRTALHELAAGRMPLASRLPSSMPGDAALAARRLWTLMVGAWQATSGRLARQPA